MYYLHGVPRFTKDLDILIDPSASNLKRLGDALKALGYRPRAPVSLDEFLDRRNWKKWKKEKGMKAFTLFDPSLPFEEIDLLVGISGPFRNHNKRRVKVDLEGTSIGMVSIPDLIRMKREAGRLKDLSDIRALEKLKKLRKIR